MKKILLIAIMAIFTTAAFANASFKNLHGETKKVYKKGIPAKNKEGVVLYSTCCAESSFSIDCGGGRMVLMGVFTLSYDCESGKVTNTDFYQTGRTCNDGFEQLQMAE